MAAGVRLRRPGDDRRGRPRQGAADRTGGPGHRGAGPPDEPGRVDHRLHQPGGDRHPRPAPGRPQGGRPVQRGDRLPAEVRRAPRGHPDRRAPRPCGAQPPHLGDGCAARRSRGRERAAQAARRTRRHHRRRPEPAPGPARPARRGPVVLPAVLLRARRGRTRTAHEAVAGLPSGGDGTRVAEDVRRPGPTTRSPRCSPSGAGPTTPRPPSTSPPHCWAGARAGVRTRWSTRTTRGRCRSCRTTR